MSDILAFAIGFIAQLVNGALGMGYGVISATALLTVGLAPAVVSASVHTSKVFTSLVSGYAHLRLGNVDRALLWRLVLPGAISGAVGAYVLVKSPGRVMLLLVSLYLMGMGLMILWRAVSGWRFHLGDRHLGVLGAGGGFLDSIGGGGWGPIVASTLLAGGHAPHYAIGTVNAAEFFVAVVQTATFLSLLDISTYWRVIVFLALGGALAAPIAAYVCRMVPARALMGLIGLLILALSLRNVVLALG